MHQHFSRVLATSALAAVMSFNTGAMAKPPNTTLVNCMAESIQNVLDDLSLEKPHEVIVKGDCVENIVIRGNRLTLKAHSSGGSIEGTDPALPTIAVTGREVTIQDFTPITGNYFGVMVHRGGTVSVLDNTIEGMVAGGSLRAGSGVVVTEASFALVSGNTIQNNARNGVAVLLSSDALIEANTIHNNGRHGIVVDPNASAEINGNTVTDNGRDGIGSFSSSFVVLSGDLVATPNIISGNARWGVNCFDGRLFAAQDFSGGGNASGDEISCEHVGF